MDIEITKKVDNALFGRKDVEFVLRHDAEGLLAAAGPGWRLVEARRETHRTPWDAPQWFQYILLKRT